MNENLLFLIFLGTVTCIIHDTRTFRLVTLCSSIVHFSNVKIIELYWTFLFQVNSSEDILPIIRQRYLPFLLKSYQAGYSTWHHGIHMADDGLFHTVGRFRLRQKRSKGGMFIYMADDGLFHTVGSLRLRQKRSKGGIFMRMADDRLFHIVGRLRLRQKRSKGGMYTDMAD